MTRFPGKNFRVLPAILGWLTVSMLCASGAWAQDTGEFGCGSLENGYGPYDYTNPIHRRDNIPVVTRVHFTQSVQTLTAGNRGSIGADIDYTLRAVPNHPGALNAMARYELSTKKSPPPGSRYTVDCWFDRAMRFKPDDGVVRMVYAIYLQKKGATDAALERYREAIVLLPGSPEPHYNLGLLYVSLGEYELAMEQARIAYAENYPLRGLRKKLEAAGAWKEELTVED